MKKIALFLIVLGALASAPSANAQIRFGVKGGLNMVSHSLSGVNYGSKDSYNGFMIGPTLEAMFGPLGVEGSLLYSQKGISLNNLDASINYLEIPVNLKMKFGIPMVKVYGYAGPYLSYGFVGDVSNLLKVNISKWDVGGNVGAGVEVFNFLQVGVNYGFGFAKNKITINNVESSYKNGVFSVTAGIYF